MAILTEQTAAIRDSCISPNETDSNLEPANVVDGLFSIARAIDRLAAAIDNGSTRHAPVDGGEPESMS